MQGPEWPGLGHPMATFSGGEEEGGYQTKTSDPSSPTPTKQVNTVYKKTL